jgi:hypothetical protein
VTTPYVLDTFTASSPPQSLSVHTSDSGATLAAMAGQTLGGTINPSGEVIGISTADATYQVYDVTTLYDNCVALTFAYVNGATAGKVGCITNAVSSGAMVVLYFQLSNCQLQMYGVNANGSTFTPVQNFTPSANLATGTYTLILSRYGPAIAGYLLNVSGQWYNPTSNAFQANKVAVLQCSNVGDQVAGLPGFVLQTISSMTDPVFVTGFKAGANVFLPPDLGCSFVGNTVNGQIAVINLLGIEGGYLPVTVELEISPNGTTGWTPATVLAGYGTSGVIVPDTPFPVTGLSASTTYYFRAIATDANSNQTTSAVISATTPASATVTAPTLGTPTLTEWTYGTTPVDTGGNPLQLHSGTMIWSWRYFMYFGCGTYTTSTIGDINPPTQTIVYGSLDLINWTQLSGGGYLSGSPAWGNVINSITYDAMNRPKIIEDGVDGFYYGSQMVSVSNSSYSWFQVTLQSSTPWSPYTYVARWASPNLGSDGAIFTDFDGSRWGVMDGAGFAAIPEGWGSIGTIGPYGSTIWEGPFAYRKGRYVGIVSSAESDFSPPNQTGVYTFGTPGSQQATVPLYPTATMFPTADPPAPTEYYAYQQYSFLRALTGQWLYLMDLYTNTSGLAPMNYGVLPVTSWSNDLPIIDYVGTCVPQAGYLTISGPTSGTVGHATAALSAALPFAMTDTITWASTDTAATFSTPTSGTLVSGSGAFTGLPTYTPGTVGAATITATSTQGYPLLAPIAFTAAASTGGPFPFFLDPSMSGGLWDGGL